LSAACEHPEILEPSYLNLLEGASDTPQSWPRYLGLDPRWLEKTAAASCMVLREMKTAASLTLFWLTKP
jgi:hypothetical protein